MAVDWNAKSTIHLKLILEALIRYQKNAKTAREKRNTKRSIKDITKVLEERQ